MAKVIKKDKVYIVFQTGLDIFSAHDTFDEAADAKHRIQQENPGVKLNVEEWDRAEAEEAYPELFR